MTKVLIVDDNQQNLYMLEVLLKGNGYEVRAAKNGAEALKTTQDTLPDLIISDILMPIMDGFALCRHWQEDEQLKNIPFIFYTATYTDSKDEAFALSLGAARFILKPAEPDAFIDILKDVLENHEAGQLTARKKPQEPAEKETTYYKEYNETLVRKLEDKMLQLEKTNHELVNRVEEVTRQREQLGLLNQAIEQISETLIITDTQATILYVNPAFERITGYSYAEAIGRNPNILQSEKQSAEEMNELWDTLTAGQIWHGRFINRKKDGTLYTDEATITPVRDKSGEIVNYVGVQRDVTHELEMEEQYRQAQKMEAVGRLTAGIAHDFNNLLTAINGFSELVMGKLQPEDPTRKMVENIRNSGTRAASLVRQLLAFSRKQIIEPSILNLNSVVEDMDKMLKRILGEDIQISTTFASDLWPVKVDPAQIEQVIVNLAVNARDAMPKGGLLMIETSNVVLDENYIAGHLDAQTGEYVLLSITDTGTGISKKIQSRIFEPFFTTKEMGQGTGLGLSTVFGIVKQNRGDIRVYSEEGHGTIFKIYLPRAKEPLHVSSLHQEEGSPRGTETILLVEDDPAVRLLADSILTDHGYSVLKAANGTEALQLAQEYQDIIHLLLTDVIMPQMGGKALADQLTDIRPDVKVLFMSGYTDEAIAHHGILDKGIVLLQKPFNTRELALKVRIALRDDK